MGILCRSSSSANTFFYVGELAAKDPEAYFHIVSKDTGFDPLVKHLKERKLRVSRVRDVGFCSSE